MKKILVLLLGISLSFGIAHANGVSVIDANKQQYLKLVQNRILVSVENQVAFVKSTQTFKNEIGSSVQVKYAFPLPVGASVISLRWNLDGEWKEAVLERGEQDTTLPGDNEGRKSNLDKYLGESQVYFPITNPIPFNTTLIVEITYVQFLKYELGSVEFVYPNDYTLIQTAPLEKTELKFLLISDRTIEKIECLSHTAIRQEKNKNDAYLYVNSLHKQANKDIRVKYQISTSELGLFGLCFRNFGTTS